MASGENVLWVVKKAQTSRPYGSDKPFAKDRYFVFRTREAARAFTDTKKAKNRNRHMTYYSPFRATWGPEQ